MECQRSVPVPKSPHARVHFKIEHLKSTIAEGKKNHGNRKKKTGLSSTFP